MAKIEVLAKEKAEKEPEMPLRSKKYIFFLVIFMGLVGLMDQYLSMIEMVVVDKTYLLGDFGLTAAEFAFWQGIYGIITFGVFVIAWFSDAFGRKKGILLLILVMGIAAILIPLTTTAANGFHWFMILYSIIILGTLSNMWEIPVMEESPARKRATYGGIAFLIGLIPLYAVLGPRIAASLGWRWCYGIMFFMMILLILFWFFMKEPERWKQAHAQREHKMLKIKTALKSLSRKDLMYIISASLVYGIWTISYKLALTWAGYFFKDVRGIPVATWNTWLLIGAICVMVGAVSSGILMDKIGRRPTLAIACIGAVIGYVGLGLTSSPIFFWIIYFFMPIVLAWIMVYFSEIFPTNVRGTCIGVTTTAARAGYVIGPLTAFVLLTAFPTMEGFWIIAGLFMIIPLFSLLLKPYETKGQTLEQIQKGR